MSLATAARRPARSTRTGTRSLSLLLVVLMALSLAIRPMGSALATAPAPPTSPGVDVTASVAEGPPGTTVTVSGTGFGRRSTGSITIGDAVAGSFQSNPQGRFSVRVQVPKITAAATYVVARTQDLVGSAPFKVTGVAPESAPAPTEPAPTEPGPTAPEPIQPAPTGPSDVVTISDTVYLGQSGHPLTGTDIHRTADALVRYTPAFGATTATNQWGVEVLVVDGRVVEVQDRVGNRSIPKNGWVLSGHGTAAQFLRNHATVGTNVSGAAQQSSPEPTPTERPESSTADTAALTWAPPAGWENYTEVVVPSTGGTINLASNVDYRIVAPVTRTEALHIRGGRNIVWVGGHIRISDKPRFASAVSRRALVFSDATDGSSVDGRTIHVEGLLIDGNDLSEGINTNAPSAVFQLQNIRVDQVIIRGADDRDGTGGYPAPSHPDIVQLWGAKKELRIDGLTGRSNYQGLFFVEAISDRGRGPNFLRRVNVEMIETLGEDGYRYAGHRGYTWTPEASGRQFLDNGTVWLAAHSSSGWTGAGGFRRSAYRNSSGTLVAEPVLGTSVFGDNLHPARRNPAPYTLQVGTDALGTYGYWSDAATVNVAPGKPAVRNFTDTGAGRVYSGKPPTGDYVPAARVGLNYRSPGYGR